VEAQVTIMMISLGRAVVALSICGLFLFSGPSWTIAADGPATAPPAPSPVTSIDQALAQVTSEDDSVRDAAIRVLVDQGDASLVPRLEAIRSLKLPRT